MKYSYVQGYQQQSKRNTGLEGRRGVIVIIPELSNGIGYCSRMNPISVCRGMTAVDKYDAVTQVVDPVVLSLLQGVPQHGIPSRQCQVEPWFLRGNLGYTEYTNVIVQFLPRSVQDDTFNVIDIMCYSVLRHRTTGPRPCLVLDLALRT
ncbi:hypothetical protein TNCV_905891 [Trichonephila clavipes]|nr:hypothetical protein TNCV_905891 [Trichonephila clavipes]